MIAGVGLLLAATTGPASAESAPSPSATAPAPVDGAPIAPPIWPGGCAATAHVDGEWGSGATGGQVLRVVVRNNATVTTKKWTVRWTLGADQRILHRWNAAINTSGSAVTATNLDYNGVLAPGAFTDFGVLLSGTGPAPKMSCTSGTPMDGTVTLTEADNGRTVYLLAGQTLAVSLGSEYRPLTLVGTALKQVSTSGGYPTGQPLVATYQMGMPTGPAELRTTTDHVCIQVWPPVPCPAPKEWKVRVYIAVPLQPAEG